MPADPIMPRRAVDRRPRTWAEEVAFAEQSCFAAIAAWQAHRAAAAHPAGQVTVDDLRGLVDAAVQLARRATAAGQDQVASGLREVIGMVVDLQEAMRPADHPGTPGSRAH